MVLPVGFNNSAKIKLGPLKDSKQMGVYMPNSDRVLSLSEIEKKIDNAKSHIAHLKVRSLSHRNPFSVKQQISLHSERLKLLESARDMIFKDKILNENKKQTNEILNTTGNSSMGCALM